MLMFRVQGGNDFGSESPARDVSLPPAPRRAGSLLKPPVASGTPVSVPPPSDRAGSSRFPFYIPLRPLLILTFR